MPPTSTRLRTLALAVGIFLFVWGARIAVIDRFGSDLPNLDQWDAEGAALFLPYFQHRLGVLDFFAPHNEHRIACTRVLALALLLFNGQWDARLECMANAALHAMLAVAVYLHLRTLLTGGRRIALLAFVALFFAAPFSWTNITAGFHTQQTFLAGFSFAAIALLLTARAWTPRWWGGTVCATLAIFSMGAGLLAAAVVFAALAASTPREWWRRHGATFAACALVLVLGAALQVRVAHHDPLRAQSIGDFLSTFWRALEWPAKFFPLPEVFAFLPLLAWLPWGWLAVRVVRRREACDAREVVIVAAGMWVLLQFAATAYARGAGGPWPASRYVDTIAMGAGVNFMALLVLSARGGFARASGVLLSRAAVLGCALTAIGLGAHVAVNFVSDLPAQRHLMREREQNVRSYLRSGDRERLARVEIPYPDAAELAERLSHAEIRAILPASVNASGEAAPLSRAGAWLAGWGVVLLALGGLAIAVVARIDVRER